MRAGEPKASLYRLTRHDASRGADVLVDAFRDDPIWRVMLKDATLDQRRAAFETPLLYCIRFGNTLAPSEGLEGIITWLPGDLAGMTAWRMLRSGALRAGLRMGNKLATTVSRLFRPVEQDRRDHMNGAPYFYIPVLGVATAHHGQGIGTRLLRAAIADSEAKRWPLYLETETEYNVGWYESFGFTVLKQIALPEVGLPVWEMVRPARA
jgi:ribosomal protein S18 acetylase RimI-like enzyme